MTFRSPSRRRAAALLAASALVLLPACGTDEPAPDAPGQGAAEYGGTAADSGDSADAADSPTAQPEGAPGEAVTDIALSWSGGQVEGVDNRVETTIGSAVRIVVNSDEPEELHLHGYDLHLDLEPGEPATLEFVADIPGVFEAELHGSGAQLFSLQVG